ncbi:hypothetical protein BDB01DRAFT_841320 [Pilobolus umbonatus]|nr:hypothetical protein BDB01DRAFT_841320 [Pilobolus umbonatus]
MKDNDIDESISTTVYFIPNAYGTYLISKLNATYNESNPNSRSYTVITPYLDEYKWDYRANIDNFFSSGRGYLAYIIALAAIFLIAMIFLRWWRIRRIRDGLNNGDFDGSNNTFNMQRVNRLDPLPVDVVNSLPIEKYSEDLITNVNCAICLEDYVPGKNDIRILPCHHGFCVLCIDPWLTQKSTLCPICKWDCLPVNLREERDNAIQHQGAADSNSPTYVINMTPPMPDPSSSHSTGNNTTGTPNEVPGQSINMNEITDNTNISSHETLQSSNEKQPIITPNNHDQPSSPPYPTTSTSTNTNNTVTDTATPTLNSHSPTIRENITPNEKDTKL